jgi:hypothetical protein
MVIRNGVEGSDRDLFGEIPRPWHRKDITRGEENRYPRNGLPLARHLERREKETGLEENMELSLS